LPNFLSERRRWIDVPHQLIDSLQVFSVECFCSARKVQRTRARKEQIGRVKQCCVVRVHTGTTKSMTEMFGKLGCSQVNSGPTTPCVFQHHAKPG
jgi:hypothetical protein